MNKILLITYHFPPDLVGVRRVVKFAQYLPEFGWQPDILTVKPSRSWQIDPSPLEPLRAHHIQIHRSRSFDPHRLAQCWNELFPRKEATQGKANGSTMSGFSRGLRPLNRWARRWVLLPDEYILWNPFAGRAALKLLASGSFKGVLTTSYPHSTHLIGLRLKRRWSHTVWCADFRDGWTQNPAFYEPPTRWHQRLHKRWEREIVQTADLVVSVSDPLTEHFRRLRNRAPEDCHTLTNGFDSADFEGLEHQATEKLTLVHTGTFYATLSPEPLLRALRRLKWNNPLMSKSLRLILVGPVERRIAEQIEAWNLNDIIDIRGPLPYRATLREQINADVCVVIVPDGPTSEGLVTQKVFEYLGSGRPILAIVPPQGACAKIVREADAGRVVSPLNEEEISKAIEAFIEQHRTGKLRPASRERILQFERRRLTERLASLLDERTRGNP